MRATLTNSGEAVSLYHQQGVLVLRIADVYKVTYGTENSMQAHNTTHLNIYYSYTQCYTVIARRKCVDIQIAGAYDMVFKYRDREMYV